MMPYRRPAVAAGLLAVLTTACAFDVPRAGTDAYDVLILGGRVVDGTGAPWYVADVGIRDGRIVAVGALSEAAARRVIDAGGRVVAPGFVDMMGVSSLPIVAEPASAESRLRQGITTMLVGEGSSHAPQNERTQPDGVEIGGRRVTWRSFADYFGILERQGIPLNVVHNVGAAQVRRIVLGDEDVAPTPAQLDAMRALVEQAMRDGAVGISTALIYPPGTYASTEELIELSKVAARHGGVYFTHMRNESGQLLEAIDEAIAIGVGAGIPVHIYHLKAAGQENWPLMEPALRRIQEARDRGIDVTADVYPYVRNGIGLGSFLHPRHYAAGTQAFLATLSDPALRAELRREVETTRDWENWYRHVGMNWDNVLLVSVPASFERELVGLSVQQAAERAGRPVWDMFFDLVQSGRVSVAPLSMDENQKHLALRAPFVSIDVDTSPTDPATAASAHPRAFGAFPRVIAKYVREDSVLSLEAAIHRMTALGANRLGLFDRGRIAVGQAADIVIFDSERLQDRATFTDPLQFAEGIDFMLVNGELVIDDGALTGGNPGRVLRGSAAAADAPRRRAQ
jgi:N-acyl-D-amino-acid deacylase